MGVGVLQLFEKAQKMANIYMKNNHIQAILLAGSVSRGWDDQHSDIELHILWKQAPTENERRQPIEAVEGQIIDFYPYEDEEWSETYLADGIKFEISNFLTSTIERVIKEVVEDGETDYDLQCLIAAVHDGVALSGESSIHSLIERAKAYPPLLTKNMILENLDFGSRWNNRRALLDRKDWLMYHSVLCQVEQKILGVLFGLNSLYVHHPAFKWMHQTIQMMTKVPSNLENRLTTVLNGSPYESIETLEALINDVIILVENEYPELNLDDIKKKVDFVRPKH